MAALAFLVAIAVVIALYRMSERLRRLEEEVAAQGRYLAGSPGPPQPPQAQPAAGEARPPQPQAVARPAAQEAQPLLPPPTFDPRVEGPGIPWGPPEGQLIAPREPVRLRAFGNRTVEELVSENLVAIVGGLLVVAGAVFFLSLAISRGWIGETGRVVIALVFGSGLVAGGLRLGGRVQRTGAGSRLWAVGSLHGVLCGAGIAVLFLGTVVGTRVYEVLGWAGLPLAVAVGALATVVAVRWQSQDLAGLGIGGALAAPILVDAPAGGGTAAFGVVAMLASSAVIVTMGWPWLLAVTLVTTAPQVAVWIAPVAHHSLVGDLGVLAAWNAAILVAAVAAELRQPVVRLRASLASISFLAASLAGVLGAREVRRHGEGELAWWFVAIAAVHLVAAAVAWAVDQRRAQPAQEQHPTPVWCLLIASAFAGMAVADAFDSAAVVGVWAFEAVALWWLSGRTSDGRARVVACVFAALTVVHVVALDAPLPQLAHGSDDLARSLLSLGVLAVATAAAAWLERRRPQVASRLLLGSAVAVLAAASIAVVSLAAPIDPDAFLISVRSQLALLALWAATAVGLCAVTALRRMGREWTGLAVVLAALVPVWGLCTIRLGSPDGWSALAAWGVLAGMGAFAALAALVASRTASAVAAGVAAAWFFVAAGRLLFELEWLLDAVWAGSGYLPHGAVLALLATMAAGLLLGGGGVLAPTAPWPHDERILWRASGLALAALAAFLVVYALSDAVVSGLTAGGRRSGTEQDAQMALSLLWGAIGVAAFVLCATRRLPAGTARVLRRASLALLGISVLKVVLLDTRQLESTFRVLVFVGLGSLLLLGAWLDQRLRGLNAEAPD